MSSSSDEADIVSNDPPKAKKRRLPRACDACRKKKTKCNSAEMPNNICSNCTSNNVECLHTIPHKKRGAHKEYIQQLERKLQNMDNLLQKLHPDQDFSQELGASPPASTDHRSSASPPASTQGIRSVGNTMGPVDPMPYLPESGQYSDDDGTVAAVNGVTQRLKNMEVETVKTRYFGTASNFHLLNQAMEMKEAYEGGPSRRMATGTFKRGHYWKAAPWEADFRRAQPQKRLEFPDDDLIEQLVSLYFTRVNPFFPFIHGPTFRRKVREQVHETDYSFGRLLSVVCALASRFTDDPRVLYYPENRLSSGFKWFEQGRVLVEILQTRYLIDTMSLEDVQVLCVSVLYFMGTGIPQGTWTTLGFAIRTCQERGIYQRLPGGSKSTRTFEDELWKRVFWFLVVMDRQLTSFLGRPSSISSEDIQVDYPEECDDEYWVIDGDLVTFQQPPDQPAIPTAFCVHLKLCELYAVSMRTLYASPRSRALFGITGDNWESRIVTELDSSLNSWLDSVPDHLRWDPHMRNPIHFDQSCLIYSVYYGLQIQIHRPFITNKESSLAFPSLAICTNSARSCSHVLEAQLKRGNMRMPHAQIAAYTSALVLLMNIYGAKKLSLTTDPARELAAVHTLHRYLSDCDTRWILAGRLADNVGEMSRVHGTLPTPGASLKRGRDTEPEQTHNQDLQSQLNPATVQHATYHPQAQAQTPYTFNYDQGAGAAPMHHHQQATYHSPTTPYETPRTVYDTSAVPQVYTSNMNMSSVPRTDWNINPYAFPSMPSDAYPGFYVDPSMSQGDFAVEDLERLSNSMAVESSSSWYSDMPTSFSVQEWTSYLSRQAPQPTTYAR